MDFFFGGLGVRFDFELCRADGEVRGVVWIVGDFEVSVA